jgi:uncharacterized protein (UPF0548 family)
MNLPHLSLAWTAATHGVGNATGFALCGILAWRRLAAEPRANVRQVDHLNRAGSFTYDAVGVTRTGETPAGFAALRVRSPIGHGRAVFEAAGNAVLSWRMHRASGVRMEVTAPRAAAGVRVAAGLGVGPLRAWAPCEVIWAVTSPREAGFGYGTLPGHPQSGEESFVVSIDDADHVWLTVTAFSRPARWFTRAARPFVPLVQRAYARWLGVTLRRLSAPPPRPSPAAPSSTH